MLGATMLRPFALALRAAHTSDVLLPPGISFPVFFFFFLAFKPYTQFYVF